MIHYTLSHLEAAASLWEAVLDLRDHPAAEPDALVRALAIRKSFEAMGTCAMRIIVVGWIDAVDAAWYRNQETCPFCFDWSFVKQWVIDTIDWSDPDNPAIRIDASGTDMTDNVTTAAQAGAKSPGPAEPQITRHDHVALLARVRAALERPDILDAAARAALIETIGASESGLRFCALPWPIDMHLGIIEHRHGVNFYAGLNRDVLVAEMAEYAREWWKEIGDRRDPHTLPDDEVIAAYFDDHPSESYSTEILRLEPLPAVRSVRSIESGAYCVLSTAHLTVQTAGLLDKWACWPPSDRPIDIAASVYGWFVPTRPLPDDRRAKIPDDLQEIIAFGRDRGFQFLLLDCDADRAADLPVHDW
jgi:hypothetical protein